MMPTQKRHRVKVTQRHSITFPAELRRSLAISAGDVVELTVTGQQITLVKVEPTEPEELPPARGILRGYFADWEDVNRYIEEERRGWQEREDDLMNALYPTGRHEKSDGT